MDNLPENIYGIDPIENTKPVSGWKFHFVPINTPVCDIYEDIIIDFHQHNRKEVTEDAEYEIIQPKQIENK